MPNGSKGSGLEPGSLEEWDIVEGKALEEWEDGVGKALVAAEPKPEEPKLPKGSNAAVSAGLAVKEANASSLLNKALLALSIGDALPVLNPSPEVDMRPFITGDTIGGSGRGGRDGFSSFEKSGSLNDILNGSRYMSGTLLASSAASGAMASSNFELASIM
jgi:hypothetical protein